MKRLLLTIFFCLFAIPCFAAHFVNNGDINWDGNWQTTGKVDVFHSSTTGGVDSAQPFYSTVWNGSGTNENLGTVVLISAFDTAAIGTLTIKLEEDPTADSNWTDVVDRASTTLVYNQTETEYPSYYFFKFNTTHTENAGTGNYRIKASSTGSTANEIFLRVDNAATGNIGVMQVLNATGTLTNGSIPYVVGVTQASTNNPTAARVTMNVNDTSTTYGVMSINSGGELCYGNQAGATYNLRMGTGSIWVYSGGIFNITGDVATKSTFLINDTAADTGIYVGGAGIFKMQGKPFGGNIWRTTTTESIAAVNDTNVNCVANLTAAGWNVGDSIFISTTSGQGQTEQATIESVSGTLLNITANWTNTHLSGAEICNMNRNVIVKGASATPIGTNDIRCYIYGYATVDADWAMFSNLGQPSWVGLFESAEDYSMNNFDVDYCSFIELDDIIAISNSIQTVGGNWSDICWWGNGTRTRALFVLATTAPSFVDKLTASVSISNSTFAKSGDSNFGVITFDCMSAKLKNVNIYDVKAVTNYPRAITWKLNKLYLDNVKIWKKDISLSTYATTAAEYGQGMEQVEAHNCIFGGDGTNIIANNFAEIEVSNVIQGKFYNTKFSTTPEIYMPNATKLDKIQDIFISSQNHNATLGRHKTWQPYGNFTDSTTALMTDQSGSGNCIVFDPASTTNGNTVNWEFKIPVTASTDPQLKFYVKNSGGGADCKLYIDVYDSDDDATLLEDNTEIALTDSWVQYTVSLDANPTQTGFCRVVLKAKDGATTGNIGVDTLTFVSGGSTYTYNFEEWADGQPMVFATGAGGAPVTSTTSTRAYGYSY